MATINSGQSFDKKAHIEKMKKQIENSEISAYSLRIPKALHKQVKIKLAKEGKQLRAVLIEMLEEYIKK